MRYHFKLDGLSSADADRLLSIEAAMLNGRTRLAVFDLKNLNVFSSQDPEKAKAFVSSRLGAYLMEPLEVLLAATGLDLLSLYHAVRGVPVVLTARPQ